MIIKRTAYLGKDSVKLEYYFEGELYPRPVAEKIQKKLKSLNVEDIVKKIWELLDKEGIKEYKLLPKRYSFEFVLPKDRKAIREFHFRFVSELKKLLEELDKINKEKDLENWLYKEMEIKL